MKTILEEVEQAIFRYEGVMFRSLDANYLMILDLEAKVQALERDNQQLCYALVLRDEEVQDIQDQLYDVQNQLCQNEYKFKKYFQGSSPCYS